jgi:hypothetical protein
VHVAVDELGGKNNHTEIKQLKHTSSEQASPTNFRTRARTACALLVERRWTRAAALVAAGSERPQELRRKWSVREQGSAAAGERAAALPRRCLRKRRGGEGELHEARDLGGLLPPRRRR